MINNYDYTLMVDDLEGNVLPVLSNMIATIETRIASLANMDANYLPYMEKEVQSLQNELAFETHHRDKLQSYVDAVPNLLSLSEDDKAALGNIDVFLGESAPLFAMKQLLFHSNLIAEITPVLEHGIMTEDQKRQVARAISSTYNTPEVLCSYYSYT